MTEQQIKSSANYIKKLATFPDASERIELYLDSLFATQPPQKDAFNEQKSSNSSAVSSLLHFTQKEIKNMATTFKKVFIVNGLCAHVLKKPSGKNSYCYEIRYRSNGYDIRVSSTNLQKAKEKFLNKTKPSEIEKYHVHTNNTNSDIFENIFEQFLIHKSKSRVTVKTLADYRLRFNRIPTSITTQRISTITSIQLLEYMNTLSARSYEDMRTVFNSIFKFAMALGLITVNPVAFVPFQRADRQIREALSEEEITTFLQHLTEPEYDKIRQVAYFYYFFGLRASELDEETHREGDFLITRNRKRKNGKIEYKKIPIPLQAENLIDWTTPLHRKIRPVTANNLFKKLLGDGKTAYNLRHTFSTLCQQYVRQEIVEIWIGDSPVRLIGKHYTHFSDKFMREEMNKVIFPTVN